MCKYCSQIPKYGSEEFYWDNELEIADESGFTTIYFGVLQNGKYYICASGDDRAWYYPKYCPECGRKL